ncbi:MAG: hypothetical protein ACW99U_19570 [Candidatus Thorarchaeota archaeon]|jgi:hypothetical protein
MALQSAESFWVEVFISDGERQVSVGGFKRTRNGLYYRYPFYDWDGHVSYHPNGRVNIHIRKGAAKGVENERGELRKIEWGETSERWASFELVAWDKLTGPVSLGQVAVRKDSSPQSLGGILEEDAIRRGIDRIVIHPDRIAGDYLTIFPFALPPGHLDSLVPIIEQLAANPVYLSPKGEIWMALLLSGISSASPNKP